MFSQVWRICERMSGSAKSCSGQRTTAGACSKVEAEMIRRQICTTTAGGTEPLWSRDGRRLFYRTAKAVMAVSVNSGSTLVVGNSEVLVEGTFEPAAGNGAPNYDVTAEGLPILMVRRNEQAPVTEMRIDVVVNWLSELSARLRSK